MVCSSLANCSVRSIGVTCTAVAKMIVGRLTPHPIFKHQLSLKTLLRCSETKCAFYHSLSGTKKEADSRALCFSFICEIYRKNGRRRKLMSEHSVPKLAPSCTNSPNLIFLSCTDLVISKDVKHLIFMPF